MSPMFRRFEFDAPTDMPIGFWRWPHFDSAKEWASRDADGSRPIVVVPDFMDLLELLRHRCEFALPLSSGYRSPAHNRAESNTGDDGPHTTGMAADIRIYGERAVKVVRVSLDLGFIGIGVSQKGDMRTRFIHVDMARETPTIWSY